MSSTFRGRAPVILLIGTVDTKSEEIAFLRESVEHCGARALVMDVGVLGRGGFTPGVAYKPGVGDRSSLLLTGLYSIKSYKLLDATLDMPATSRRPRINFNVGWRDATQVAYHGLGIESPEDRSSF